MKDVGRHNYNLCPARSGTGLGEIWHEFGTGLERIWWIQYGAANVVATAKKKRGGAWGGQAPQESGSGGTETPHET